MPGHAGKPPSEMDAVNSLLRWISALFSTKTLSFLIVIIVLTILASSAAISFKYVTTRFYKEALEIQEDQLDNIQAILDLHKTTRGAYMERIEQLEELLIVQDLELLKSPDFQ